MIGETVGQYRILEELGGGSMGRVYRAEDTRLGRTVALKVLSRELSLDPMSKARFLREARAASRLDHPNICTVYEIDEAQDGRLYIVMPYYRGETLRRRLERGPLPVAEAVAIARQVALGLAAAHAADVIHRDVKPANVLLSGGAGEPGRADSERVKILDFGFAKVAGDVTLTDPGAALGTPAYMSPEHIQGEIDARSDLWSLGVVLYEMLAGVRPFPGDHTPSVIHAVLCREPAPVETWRPDTPAWLARLAGRLLAKDPAQRIASAEAVLACLAVGVPGAEPEGSVRDSQASTAAYPPLEPAVAAPAAAEPSGETPAGGAPRSPRRTVVPAALATAALAVTLAGWLWLGRGTEPPPAPASSRVSAIAVLPFDDLSQDPGPGFFADGLTEALITDLASVSGLRVISRAATMRYKERVKPLSRIARELGVDYLLEGSVVRGAGRVRIRSRLVHGESGRVLWSESYERPLLGILDLQREVARAMAEQIEARLTPGAASAPGSAARIAPAPAYPVPNCDPGVWVIMAIVSGQ